MPYPELRDRRILIVEDDAFMALELAMELQSARAIVVGPASTVQVGLDLIAREPSLDAAILDVNLHGERVFPIADELLAQHVAFIFATGESRTLLPTRFASIHIFQKPNSPSELMIGVARLLAT